MADEFRGSFEEMAREAELAELRKEIGDLKNNNPISDIGKTINVQVDANIEGPSQDAGNAK